MNPILTIFRIIFLLPLLLICALGLLCAALGFNALERLCFRLWAALNPWEN